MRLMFQLTNNELANSKHRTNITNLHQQKDCNESKHNIEIIHLIDFDKNKHKSTRKNEQLIPKLRCNHTNRSHNKCNACLIFHI
jgi:hypothetical protein